MARQDYRVRQGRIGRNSNEAGVRNALANVHARIEARIRRRRAGLADDDRLDETRLRHYSQQRVADDRRFDPIQSHRDAFVGKYRPMDISDIADRERDTHWQHWDRIAAEILIVAALAFAAALWLQMYGAPDFLRTWLAR